MTRTLFHSFDPPAASPVSGATVDLEVSEIEDAGIREVLQTPGAAYGAWSILDALLTLPAQARRSCSGSRSVKHGRSRSRSPAYSDGSSRVPTSSATSTSRSSPIGCRSDGSSSGLSPG